MKKKELLKLLEMVPDDCEIVCLVKSNTTMHLKDVHVVNSNTIMLIPFGMKPSDTLLQDFENQTNP